MTSPPAAIAMVVTEAFTRITGTPPPRGPATTPDDAPAWDSLAQVQIVFEIEQELGVRLPEDHLVTRTSLAALIEATRAVAA